MSTHPCIKYMSYFHLTSNQKIGTTITYSLAFISATFQSHHYDTYHKTTQTKHHNDPRCIKVLAQHPFHCHPYLSNSIYEACHMVLQLYYHFLPTVPSSICPWPPSSNGNSPCSEPLLYPSPSSYSTNAETP